MLLFADSRGPQVGGDGRGAIARADEEYGQTAVVGADVGDYFAVGRKFGGESKSV